VNNKKYMQYTHTELRVKCNLSMSVVFIVDGNDVVNSVNSA